MPPTTCRALIKDYCRNCSFAGIRYIADEEKHWCERWFWFALVALAWYASALLIIAAWNAYTLSPISFGVETTYIDWDTKMPAVAVCETSNDDMLYNISDTIWPPGHLLDLEDALKEITYFRGLSYKLVNRCYLAKNPDPLCPTANFSYYASLVRSPCHKILRSCSYNKRKFECCEYFQTIDTDMGRCFIINSLQTENSNHRIPMVSNITNKNGFLRFEVLIPSSVYTIGEDEVPTITTLQSSLITTLQSPLKLKKGYHHQRRLAVRNIVNDPLIVQTTPEQRACRLHQENEGGVYPYYSYSACTVLCRKRAQLDLCKCNDHFMLGASIFNENVGQFHIYANPMTIPRYGPITEEERCNISGMACLHFHENHLTLLKPKWASRAGMSCNCVPSCHETEITVIKDVVTANRKDKTRKANVEVVLAYLPTERFKRSVVRSSLDLVVSIGGTTGLFLGASLLSFAEIIVYFTVRFITNIWIEHQKRRRVTETQTRINQAEKFSTGFQHGRNKNYRSQFTYLS